MEQLDREPISSAQPEGGSSNISYAPLINTLTPLARMGTVGLEDEH